MVTRASKRGIADFGAGLGYGIPVVIVPIVISIVTVFLAIFFFALGRDLRGISVN